MKMTPAQRARLAVLLLKSTLLLTDGEAAELVTLKSLAVKEGITITQEWCDTEAKNAVDGPTPLTDDQIKSIVGDALNGVLAEKGFDQAAILTAITEGNKGHITEETVKAAVADAAKAFGEGKTDTATVIAELKSALLESQKSNLTAEALTKALGDWSEAQRKSSLMVHQSDGGTSDLIEHRLGNLSLAQKQLLNLTLRLGINEGVPAAMLARGEKAGSAAITRFKSQGFKALTTTGVSSGAELIPADLSSDLQMRLYIESNLAATLASQEVQMPTGIYKLPLTTTRTAFYTGSENPGTDPLASQPGTGQVILASAKLIGVAEYSYEADEDSIVPVLPMLQNDMAQGAAASFEGALVNGDVAATHQDSDYAGIANHHAKLFDGFRKYALTGVCTKDLTTGGISAPNIGAMRKSMNKWGVKPSDCFILVGARGYNDIVNLPETLTAEKVGNPATARILTGAAAVLYGMPIIVSEQVREDLNATGKFDNTVKTQGSIFIIHKPSWYVGTRGSFLVETDENKVRQKRMVIASFRRAFKPKETPTVTLPQLWMGMNYLA